MNIFNKKHIDNEENRSEGTLEQYERRDKNNAFIKNKELHVMKICH